MNLKKIINNWLLAKVKPPILVAIKKAIEELENGFTRESAINFLKVEVTKQLSKAMPYQLAEVLLPLLWESELWEHYEKYDPQVLISKLQTFAEKVKGARL